MNTTILLWLVCGVACFYIAKKKNCTTGACILNALLGVLLGILWVIVMLVKKDKSQNSSYEHSTGYDGYTVDSTYTVSEEDSEESVSSENSESIYNEIKSDE